MVNDTDLPETASTALRGINRWAVFQGFNGKEVS